MEELYKAITEIDILSPPKDYVRNLLRVICDELGYSYGSVIDVDSQGKGFIFASYNLPNNYPQTINQVNVPVLSSPSGEAIKKCKIVIVQNPLSEERLVPWHEIIRTNNIQTITWVPLLSKGRALGTYILYDTKVRDISEEKQQLLKQIGVMISIAISSNQYLDQLNQKTGELIEEVHKRKRAQLALSESERFSSGVFESIRDNLCVIDNQYNILKVNPVLNRLYDTKQLIGEKCYYAFHDLEQICKNCPGKRVLETGKSASGIITLKNSKGEIKGWFEVHSHPFIDMNTGEIKGVIKYGRDITDKVKMEQEIARLDRLNLVGEMAASISHEVRNPMTTVRGFLQLLQKKEDCKKYNDYFNLMIEELDRANSIITEFLSLAKDRPLDLIMNNINSVVEILQPLIIAHAVLYDTTVKIELSEIPNLYLDEKEIRQLILNLVRNGLEAMSPGKTLTISTYIENDTVILAVGDQGEGIKSEIMAMIGTPFFTTKEQGTGLGLAVCYRIAARHNARINIKTDSTGTTFEVRFKASSLDNK
ncbi:multi-sensor signal transduction histidine kinase [Desulfofarcimen acetoxidans DSM 771]|uniref:histidine kinase n=1 Tax=Desulfofarcimen acetoxidans (strain ATCC 49208 / DSM 771 / KCTC 5769 / VKM B-1644 / 5575) TaxID=485916 RepID=C8VXV2_DESAS|nr:ATP-binding protein [Desulfofarcimen acetoxidans]ACV62758.1 multi-sensor signal transduction histidine kinase [Desulfofarcimen acetoxidans DSM 771]